MMRDNDRLLALKIFHIVVSVLVLFALGLIVYFYVMVYLGVRKRKLSQIPQVSELVLKRKTRTQSSYDHCFGYDSRNSFLLPKYS